ncbi:hypothetical protein M8J77_013451 [Diaphorina citri]|nr:hypothetical protein M8J77_013451 [Diaphorina citri]
MVIQNHLSSDISTNLLVASIAEELTNTIKDIDINKSDRNKILDNLLEINKIVEQSKSQQKFFVFKSQLEEIQSILNEPIHKSWMDKILTKTQNLINFMRHSQKELENETTENENEPINKENDLLRQCFNEWNEMATNISKQSKKETQTEFIDPKASNVKIIHVSPNWENSHSYVSESEVLIVNYSRIIRHENSDHVREEADRMIASGETRNEKLERVQHLQDEGLKKQQEDLYDLNQELRGVLFNKFSETKSPEKTDHKRGYENHDPDALGVDTCKQWKETTAFVNHDNTEVTEPLEEENLKERKKKGKRERKCNISSNRHKTTERSSKGQTPPTIYSVNNDAKKHITRKKLNRLGNCRNSSDSKTAVTNRSHIKDEKTVAKYETNATSKEIDKAPHHDKADPGLFEYLGNVSYKKLQPGDELSTTKVEDLLTKFDDKTKKGERVADKDKTVKNKGDRNTTKQKTKRAKYLNAADVEDLKSRCASIRKQLESIESKAAFLKTRNTKLSEEQEEDDGLVQDEDYQRTRRVHANNSHLGYLCNIM